MEISIYDYLISVSSLLNISISNGPHAALDMAVVEKGADSHGWGGGQDENLNRAVTFWCGNIAREYACTVIVQVIKCNRK